MELRVWIGTVQRVIAGVSPTTTSEQVILALAQATGKTGRFSLIEKWRNYERPLAPHDCPLQVSQRYGDSAPQVKFILKRTGEVTGAHRRLAEAKSPKPQKRRSAIKKSMSFSGTVSPCRSPKHFPVEASIAEDEPSTDSSYINPEPSLVPQRVQRERQDSLAEPPVISGHPTVSNLKEPKARRLPPHLDDTQANTHSISQYNHTRTSASNSPSLIATDPQDRLSSSRSSPSISSDVRQEKVKRQKSRDRSTEKRDSRARAEREQRDREEKALREYAELEQSIAAYERRLEEETRKLHNLHEDITLVSEEEESNWLELYRLRESVGKAVTQLDKLDEELEHADEVILSEELNVLLRRRHEMNDEMRQLQDEIDKCDNELGLKREESSSLMSQLSSVIGEGDRLQEELARKTDELSMLQKRLDGKKGFLEDAEQGYMSACDDLKEADSILEKRQQMIVELERELREYNLKSFINTGFNDKHTNMPESRPIHNVSLGSETKGLLV